MVHNSKLPIIITPIFVILLPIFLLFEKNPGEIWVEDFLLLSVFLTALVLSVTIVFFVVRKSLLIAALATGIVFSPLLILCESDAYAYNLGIWLLASLLAMTFLFAPIPNTYLKKAQEFVLFSCSVFIGFLTISICKSKLHITQAKKRVKENLESELSSLINHNPIKNHFESDIYCIILDEFISPNTFSNYYKYDNKDFFSFLNKVGFQLVKHSYSNYAWTIPSISSLVSLQYHKNWVAKKEFPQIAQALIEYNLIGKLLKQEGYKIYSIPSIYWLGNTTKGIWKDFLLRTKSYGLIMSVLRSTPFAPKARGYQCIQHRHHIFKQLKEIRRIIENKEKKFVFVHLLCPHRPIVFDKTGNKLCKDAIFLSEKDSKHLYYLDQAYFISKEIEKIIEKILCFSKKPPLILLLSDHGKFPIGVSGKGKITLPLNELSWRFSNLIALRLPDPAPTIPDVFTLTNAFRIILKHYFGYNLELLEDVCYTNFLDFNEKFLTSNLIDFQNIE